MALFKVKPQFRRRSKVLSYYGTADNLYENRSYNLAATSIGNYALFGGGVVSYDPSNSVTAYNTSLTRTKPSGLSQARVNLAATSIGNYALFSGGENGLSNDYTYIVDVYDSSLTKLSNKSLNRGRSDLAATSVGDYALFAGGYYNNGSMNFESQIDAFNSSLTRFNPGYVRA